MSNIRFDLEGFFSALDGCRIGRNKSWKQVADEAGVSASTLTRMGQGKRPDVDGLAALAGWSGIEVSEFYRDGSNHGSKSEPLAEIIALLRADKNLTTENAAMLETMIKSVYETISKQKKIQT